LEGLVKLARRRKDVKEHKSQIVVIHSTPIIKKVNGKKTHCSKTLHLAIEINQAMIEGLVDIGASMLVMTASVVRELGIMHLVFGHETYKTTFSIVTRALGRIT
jgi:predicted aspartyl protease